MKRTGRVALALALVGAAAMPGASASDAGGGCGSDPSKPLTLWHGSAVCHFQFRGFPLTVFGNSTKTGTATVHVWISVTETSQAIVECSGSGSGYASCNNGFPDSSTMIDGGLQLQTIWCHVEGAGGGNYRCQSGNGR